MKNETAKTDILSAAEKVQQQLSSVFGEMDRIAEVNTVRVMDAFRSNRVSEVCFAGSTGYGYDDVGRETLDKIYADVFGAEAALVRSSFVNGTHALTAGLFSLAGPGEKILSVTGMPYDTLCEAIGLRGEQFGSLKYYGIEFEVVDLLPGTIVDKNKVKDRLESDPSIKAVFLQRSRGYEDRKALTVQEIEDICTFVHQIRPDINIMVDNCYGEFTETREPTHCGADLIAGSLIKNPGGGLALTGGYLAGKKELIERASFRLTSPGIGGECGATLNLNRNMFQGFFMAPHIVIQALKTAAFAAGMLEYLGIETSPASNETRSDIIQMIRFGDPNRMKAFCCGIQSGSPVDSYVSPEPWQMPGYDCPVIMAAGAFVQGSSIEISADGPFKDPYILYMQGGLTYESGKYGVLRAIEAMLNSESA